VLAILLTLLVAAPPLDPTGLEVHLSGCASGGFDHFVFKDGLVLAKCWGCESRPHVMRGAWTRDGTKIRVAYEEEWFGYGRGEVRERASVNVFADYVAIHRIGTALERYVSFDEADFRADQPSCATTRRHQLQPDPHRLLWQFQGKHPETGARPLTQAEFGAMDAKELRLTRNEIFARYGKRFDDKGLEAHFRGFAGYDPHLSDVDAFLSEVERENVRLLSVAEEKR
jgi:hypothetical protein